MSEGKENPEVNPKESSKDTSKETQQVDLSKLFEGKASQGEQGISLEPVGSQATDPFAPQDSSPTITPETPQPPKPTQAAPVDTPPPHTETPSPSQTAPESSDD